MDVCSFLNSLKLPFHFEFDKFLHNKNSANFATIRSDLNIPKDACALLKEIGKKTNTHFIYCFQTPDPRFYIFRKKWVCRYSEYNQPKNSKTNLKCPVFVDILIKKINDGTKSYDSYLKPAKPFPCVIRLRLAHSHNIHMNIHNLNAPKVSPKIKLQFEEYFNRGMNVTEALEFHESRFIYGDEPLENTTYSQANHIYDLWKTKRDKQNYIAPFKPIIEKMPIFESQGTTVKLSENLPWSVIVVTSVMKRSQSLPSSQGMIFIDSTACHGKDDTVVASVTTMLTMTKVGVLPIAVLLHQNQSFASYNDAFLLLEKSFPQCFGGKKAPSAFMTENITPLKNALSKIWESSEQLLYHYHIKLVEWRWLMSADCGVDDKSIRKDALHIFLSVMYADSEKAIQEAKENALQLSDEFPAFVERLNTFLEKKREWILHYSLSYFHYNDKFRIFCENSVRIFKDVVVCNTQRFFILSFIEYCISVWEVHLIEALLEHVNNISLSQQNLLFASIADKYANSSDAPVQEIDSETFLIPSCSVKNLRYIVQTKLGFCTCNSGKFGAFCKHLSFLYDQNQLHFTWTPTLTALDQFSLTRVALGEEMAGDVSSPICTEDESMDTGDLQSRMPVKNKLLGFISEPDYYYNPHALRVQRHPNISQSSERVDSELAFQRLLNSKQKNETELTNPPSKRKTGDTMNSAEKTDILEIIAEMNRDLTDRTRNQCNEQTDLSPNQPSTSYSSNIATERDLSEFKKEVIRLSKFNVHRTRLIKLTRFLSNINNSAQLNQALTDLNSTLSDVESYKKKL